MPRPKQRTQTRPCPTDNYSVHSAAAGLARRRGQLHPCFARVVGLPAAWDQRGPLMELLPSLGRHITHLGTCPAPRRPHLRLGNLAIENPTISAFEPDLLQGYLQLRHLLGVPPRRLHFFHTPPTQRQPLKSANERPPPHTSGPTPRLGNPARSASAADQDCGTPPCCFRPLSSLRRHRDQLAMPRVSIQRRSTTRAAVTNRTTSSANSIHYSAPMRESSHPTMLLHCSCIASLLLHRLPGYPGLLVQRKVRPWRGTHMLVSPLPL
ncbi:hypothetical protein VTI74DRAFT_3914 [Chaetomium olivicolor]